MDYLKCDSRATQCIASCFGFAIASCKTMEGIDLNKIESLQQALNILCKGKSWLPYLDALIQMERGDLATAVNTLQGVLHDMPNNSSIKSTLAMALFLQKDPGWESLADEINEDKNASRNDIEQVHLLWQSNWNNQGLWSQEKLLKLKQELHLRFDNPTNNVNTFEKCNTTEDIKNYSIRM